MSKEYYAFKDEIGKTAFLAGVVDVMSDRLSRVCDFSYDFDADIFYIPDNDFSLLDNSVKKRLSVYNQYIENSCINQKDIDNIHFELEKIEEDITGYVYKSFQDYSSNPNLKEKIDEFFSDLNWHLQKPICIYKPSSKCSNEICNILGHIYLYLAFNYFFIAYDEYMILFVFGTTE